MYSPQGQYAVAILYNIIYSETFYDLFFIMWLCDLWLWYMWPPWNICHAFVTHNITSHPLSKSQNKENKRER